MILRILSANLQRDCDAGLFWGLNRLGHEVRVCELRWLPPGDRLSAWHKAWNDFGPDIVFVSGYWLGRIRLADLEPPPHRRRVPLVYWAYDDPVFTAALSLPILPKAALILTPAEECLDIYRKDGCRTGLLPFGCNPEIQRHTKPVECHQFVLVANNYSTGWTTPFRLKSMDDVLVPIIAARYDIKVWGLWWIDGETPYRVPQCFHGGHLPHERLAEIYGGACVVLGLQFHNLSRTQTSSRVFETLACRAFFLGPDTRGTRTYFQPGKHLVLTNSPQETLSLAKHYLAHPAERERIAAAGQMEVYRNHTYLHRAREFLAEVERL